MEKGRNEDKEKERKPKKKKFPADLRREKPQINAEKRPIPA